MINGELNQEQFRQLQEALKSWICLLPDVAGCCGVWRNTAWKPQQSAMCATSSHRRGISGRGRQTRRKGKMLRNMPKLIRIREMPETDSVRLYLAGGHYRNAKEICLPAWWVMSSRMA